MKKSLLAAAALASVAASAVLMPVIPVTAAPSPGGDRVVHVSQVPAAERGSDPGVALVDEQARVIREGSTEVAILDQELGPDSARAAGPGRFVVQYGGRLFAAESREAPRFLANHAVRNYQVDGPGHDLVVYYEGSSKGRWLTVRRIDDGSLVDRRPVPGRTFPLAFRKGEVWFARGDRVVTWKPGTDRVRPRGVPGSGAPTRSTSWWGPRCGTRGTARSSTRSATSPTRTHGRPPPVPSHSGGRRPEGSSPSARPVTTSPSCGASRSVTPARAGSSARTLPATSTRSAPRRSGGRRARPPSSPSARAASGRRWSGSGRAARGSGRAGSSSGACGGSTRPRPERDLPRRVLIPLGCAHGCRPRCAPRGHPPSRLRRLVPRRPGEGQQALGRPRAAGDDDNCCCARWATATPSSAACSWRRRCAARTPGGGSWPRAAPTPQTWSAAWRARRDDPSQQAIGLGGAAVGIGVGLWGALRRRS